VAPVRSPFRAVAPGSGSTHAPRTFNSTGTMHLRLALLTLSLVSSGCSAKAKDCASLHRIIDPAMEASTSALATSQVASSGEALASASKQLTEASASLTSFTPQHPPVKQPTADLAASMKDIATAMTATSEAHATTAKALDKQGANTEAAIEAGGAMVRLCSAATGTDVDSCREWNAGVLDLALAEAEAARKAALDTLKKVEFTDPQLKAGAKKWVDIQTESAASLRDIGALEEAVKEVQAAIGRMKAPLFALDAACSG